jgi:uncharacterized protein YqhQ
VVTLVESLKLGFSALRFSAEQQMTDEERAEARESGRSAIFISTMVALGLFIALPQVLAWGAGKLFGVPLAVQDPLFHAVTGGFKLLVFVAYLVAISRIPEVRRVFQYHGAEHKTIFAWEAGLPLTVENVRKQSTLHPRCGTTFLVVVVVVSILIGALVTPVLLPHAEGLFGQLQTLLLRITLLVPVAALSYELQRLSARYCTTGPLQIVLWPGFLCQKITTREPDDTQIEIAIAAMKAAAWREEVGAQAPVDEEPRVFASFERFLEELPAAGGYRVAG